MKSEIKKIVLVFGLVFFFLGAAFSLSIKDFSLSIEPLFGMKYGQVDEYVFLNYPKQSSDKLSELNWEISPELYGGVKIRGGWKGIFQESFFTAGIPMRTGLMKDSDWRNTQFTTANGGNTVKTNYSESDNYLEYDFSFGFKGGYEFQFFDWLKIKPALAFEYQNIKFVGKNGDGWYGTSKSGGGYYPYDDTRHQTVYNWDGQNIIAYNRIADYLWLGCDFSIDLSKIYTLSTGFFLAPYVYAISYDSHFLTNKDFADKTTGYFSAFKWNLGFECKIAKSHSILLTASYFYMTVIRGADYMKSNYEKNYIKSTSADGGAGARWFDLSLSYKLKIL